MPNSFTKSDSPFALLSEQIKIIGISKAVLEARSPKYQEIMTFGSVKTKTNKSGLNNYE